MNEFTYDILDELEKLSSRHRTVKTYLELHQLGVYSVGDAMLEIIKGLMVDRHIAEVENLRNRIDWQSRVINVLIDEIKKRDAASEAAE